MTSRNLSNEISSLERIHNRLNLTSNDDYTSIVNNLLPKLLGMMNDSELRPSLIPIMSSILKRVKQLECCLSLAPLFDQVSAATMPFTCNFAITFIDVTIKNLNNRNMVNTVDPKDIVGIFRIDEFPLFSPQHNALCDHFLSLMKVIPESFKQFYLESNSIDNFASKIKHIRLIFSDLILDVALLQSLMKGAIGSIAPGLSSERIERLTSKRNGWSSNDLKLVKSEVLETLLSFREGESPLLDNEYLVVITIILSIDIDHNIALAARNKLEIWKSMRLWNENRLFEVICSLVTGGNVNNALLQTSMVRSKVKDEVAYALINWINANISKSQLQYSDNLFSLPYSILLGASTRSFSHSFLRVEGAALKFLHQICDSLPETRLSEVLSSITQTVKESLTFQMSSIQNQAAAQMSSNLQTASQEIILSRLNRTYCYDLIKLLSSRCSQISADIALIVMLFRLVDIEDNEIAPRLFEALHVLRESSESLILSNEFMKAALKAYLLTEKDSKEPKKRKLVLQWVKTIYHWSIETIDSFYKSFGKLSLYF